MKRLAFSMLAVLLLPAAAFASELTDQERRGREIYLRGTSATGADVVALIGAARTEVSAAILPCGGCHGADGRGRPQGELAPADLTWQSLRASGQSGGRQRPAYDEALLKRAITRGVDAAGNPLHVAMPRYRLTSRDAGDLIAYIRRLGNHPNPESKAD